MLEEEEVEVGNNVGEEDGSTLFVFVDISFVLVSSELVTVVEADNEDIELFVFIDVVVLLLVDNKFEVRDILPGLDGVDSCMDKFRKALEKMPSSYKYRIVNRNTERK